MRHTTLATFLLLVLLLCSSAEAGRTEQAAGIVLKDGRSFTDVKFRLDRNYKVITIKTDAGDITVSFTNIARIEDSEGRDVTEKYLGRFAPSSEGTASSLEGDAALASSSRASPRPFKIGLRVGVNRSIPIGRWWYRTQAGFGFDGDLIVSIAREQGIRIGLSKTGLRHNVDEFVGSGSVVEDHLNFTAWRYFVAFEYFKWPGFKKGRNVRSYIYSGLGAISYQLSGSAIYRAGGTDDYYAIVGTSSPASKFMVTSGVGMTVMVSRSFGFDFATSFDIVFVESRSSSHYQDDAYQAYVLDFKVGIIFLGR